MHHFLGLLSLATPFAHAAPDDASPRTVSAGIVTGALRPGSTCDGVGAALPLVLGQDAHQRDGSLVQPFVTGCGCPTGPVFTLLFEPGTSPLEVRVCATPANDSCEKACRGELVWDLGDALDASGARAVRIVD